MARWWDRVSENKAHVPLPWANVPEACGKESGYSNTWDQLQVCRITSKWRGLSESHLHPSYKVHTSLCVVHLPGLLGDAVKKASLFVLLMFASFPLLPKEAFPVGV